MTVVDAEETKDVIVHTDYLGKKLPHNVGDEVPLTIHGKEYTGVVQKHTYFEGSVCGGEITYKIEKPEWKRVNL